MKRITSFLLAVVLFAGFVLIGAPTAHAASNMTSSDMLVEFIKENEGFTKYPMWDYAQYSVGYGCACPDDMLDTYSTRGITEKEAEVLLRNHMASAENAVNRKFIQQLGLNLTQGQFDALVSFTFGSGSAWMYDDSGIFYNAIVNGATGSELIHAFSLWVNAGGSILPGLVRRRLSEANMYLNGLYSTQEPDNYGYVYYNANGGSVQYRIQGYDANEGVAPAYTPYYAGHTFSGWYTSQTGGEKVTALTMAYSGDTLYARWDGGAEDTTQPETTPVDGVKIKVTAYDVNLRKGPGTNYSIVGSVTNGDELVITETAEGTGYTWGKGGDKWIALIYTNYDQAVKEQQKEPEATTPETTVPETTAPAVTEQTGTVKANGGLALRTGPGTGYAYIRYLDNGSKVTITEQKTVGSMTWGKTSEGWISMSYVVLDKVEPKPEATTPETTVPETTVPETTVPETTVPETTVPETTVPETTPPAAGPATGTVKAEGGLNVRSGPGFNYDYISFCYNGQKVTVTEQQTVGGTTWGKISQGWISMKYVELDNGASIPETTVPETTVPEVTEPEPTEPEYSGSEQTYLTGTVKAEGGLAVRRGAGTSYAVKEYLFNTCPVTITEVQEVNGTKWGYMGSGWICMNYVVLDGESSGSSESTSSTKTIIADCLNVRQSPSLYASIVSYYYYGAMVEVTETTDADGITWGKTSSGWISMDYAV